MNNVFTVENTYSGPGYGSQKRMITTSSLLNLSTLYPIEIIGSGLTDWHSYSEREESLCCYGQ